MKSEYQNSWKVYIISEHFLLRLGLKTILEELGVKAEIQEISEWREWTKILNEAAFVIIDMESIPEKERLNFDSLPDKFPKCKVFLLGNGTENKVLLKNFISVKDNQQEILDKFQRFFIEQPDEDEMPKESSVLSEREIEVLKEVSMGYSNKEIADRLFISINTVITHRKNITEKLEIKTIAGLTVYALMNKLIRPEDSQK